LMDAARGEKSKKTESPWGITKKLEKRGSEHRIWNRRGKSVPDPEKAGRELAVFVNNGKKGKRFGKSNGVEQGFEATNPGYSLDVGLQTLRGRLLWQKRTGGRRLVQFVRFCGGVPHLEKTVGGGGGISCQEPKLKYAGQGAGSRLQRKGRGGAKGQGRYHIEGDKLAGKKRHYVRGGKKWKKCKEWKKERAMCRVLASVFHSRENGSEFNRKKRLGANVERGKDNPV